jgi:endonuclease/exonuclease/phosphatase family metal-dependent hydrolase
VSGALVVLVEGDPGGPLAVVLWHLGCAVEAAATEQLDAARGHWVTAHTMLFQVPGVLVDNGDADDKGRWRF